MAAAPRRARAAELSRQADATPVVERFRTLLEFVGSGRRATQAGRLTRADTLAAAQALDLRGVEAQGIRSMNDVTTLAQLFDWALASGLLRTRRTRVLPGAYAHELSNDPLAAWFKLAVTLLEAGLLGGFRRGWRKHYVEFLDARIPGLLIAVLGAGGSAPLAEIKDLAWQQVAEEFDYEPDDANERYHVERLCDAVTVQLADLGAAARSDATLQLTELGRALARVSEMLTEGGT